MWDGQLECKLQNFSIGADWRRRPDEPFWPSSTRWTCLRVRSGQGGAVQRSGLPERPAAPSYWCEHCGKEREDRLCPECYQVCDLMEDHLRKQAKEASGRGASDTSEPARMASRTSHGFRFPWQKREKPPWEG